MVETEKCAAEDLVYRPCWGEFRRYSTGDLVHKSCWRVFESCWETRLEESGARRNLWLGNKRCKFPPMHYLTMFQVWTLPLLGERGIVETHFAGDKYLCWR